jgi:hypothetical protein
MRKIEKTLYYDEISTGVEWLFNIQEKENFGWSWIKHISPNIQNTAEVIYALAKNCYVLDDNQKEYLRRSVEYWLLEPQFYAVLSRDWIWVLLALDEYSQCEIFESDKFDIEVLAKTRQTIVSNILELQNDDGGWADNSGGISAISRTGLAIKALSNDYKINPAIEFALNKAISFIIEVQNDDGGFGNMRKGDLLKDSQKKLLELAHENVEAQYLSNAACTSYCIMGLNSISPHKYAKQLARASSFLVSIQNEDGHWDLFYEVGIKKDTIFTFRHFGTAWALKALFDNNAIDNGEVFLLRGIQYLLKLQDHVYGGWRSSPDSDTYTWSTCNALCIMAEHKEYYENIKAEVFYKLLNERNLGNNKIETVTVKKQKKTLLMLSAALYGVSIALLYTLIGVLCFDGGYGGNTVFKFFIASGYVLLLVPLDIYLYKRHKMSKINGLLILLLVNIVGILLVNFL